MRTASEAPNEAGTLLRAVLPTAPRARRATTLGVAIALAAAGGAVRAQGLPFTETFDDADLRDDALTRADWGASEPGELRFPSAEPLADPFGPSSVAEDLLGTATTRALALADMNGDGHIDLIEGAFGRSGVYLSNGDGTFAARADLEPVSANTRGIAAGDLDRDGDIDVVAGNFNGRPRLYLNSGDGMTFTGSDVSTDVRLTDWVALADVDGDGFLDVVTANHDTSNRIYLNTGDPQQPFGASGVDGIDLGDGTDNTQAVAAGDLDNDGDVDLVALNENQVNTLHLNDGTGGFATAPIGSDADNSQGGALGDLDGDGFLDLVVANGLDGVGKIYFNSGGEAPFEGATGAAFTSTDDLDHIRSIVLADADHDGDLDIFVSTAEEVSPGNHENFLYFNDGEGGFPTHVTIGTETDVTNALAVADVDGDGDLDLITGNEDRDAEGDAHAAVNRLYRNAGTPADGEPVVQLRGAAASLRVDAESEPIATVRLDASPAAQSANTEVDFWVSSNGGEDWLRAVPGGPAVEFSTATRGQDLRWRAVLNALSPAAEGGAAGFALDSVTLALDAPAFTSMPPAAAAEGEEYVYAITASAPGGNGDLTITANELPSWLTLTDEGGGSAELRGTPPEGSAGDHPVELRVEDADGAADTQAFTIAVAAPDDGGDGGESPSEGAVGSSGGDGGGGGTGLPGLLALALLAAARLAGRLRRQERARARFAW